MAQNNSNLRVLAWGTYDLSKPRVRIMLQAMRELAIEVTECHVDVWGDTIDKSQIKGSRNQLKIALRWLLAYPRLLWRFTQQPKPDVVFIGYLGQIDVLILWPFARFTGTPIVWDAFLSLYNTVIEDRKLYTKRHPVAKLLFAVEWLACRAADKVILDTRAHANYFVDQFRTPKERTSAIFVGVEPDRFKAQAPRATGTFTVLFYGQFIPLHGIPTIINAARLLQNHNVEWVLIGKGQQEVEVRTMIENHPINKLRWIPWVKYAELIEWISTADVCLGIFDDGDKASRVIPNKVFQVIEAGKPLITRDSPAIRELVSTHTTGIFLVPPNNGRALASAVTQIMHSPPSKNALQYTDIKQRFSTRTIGKLLYENFSSISLR